MRLVPASTYLAWSMLVRDSKRFLSAIGAITLATMAAFVGLGFFTGLHDSQGLLTSVLDADLVVFNRRTKSLVFFTSMFRSELYRLTALDGVREVVPMQQGDILIKQPETGMYKSIQFFAFPPEAVPLRLPKLAQLASRLQQPGTVVFDSLSREYFGPIAAGMEIDLQGIPVRVLATTPYGPNFAKQGSIFMDLSTLRARLGMRRNERISFGLVRASPGVSVEELKARVKSMLPEHLEVATPEELYYREARYTLEQTPAGALLALGLLVAVVVGCVVAYQVLYTEITDHLAQFATCKAMGFSPRFLSRLVFQEALLLSLLGFPTGILASLFVYQYIQAASGTVMELTAVRVAFGYFLTLVMCATAARVAVVRAIEADPADLF